MHVDNHIEDGWIILGDEPGLGITFDEDKLAAATVDAPSPQAAVGLWGRRRGAALYPVAAGRAGRDRAGITRRAWPPESLVRRVGTSFPTWRKVPLGYNRLSGACPPRHAC